MSRKKVIAGNWKMNNNLAESVKLVNELKEKLAAESVNCDVIICPPFISLNEVSKLVEGTQIKLGAQNMYFAENGAFTGQISAAMLLSVGCKYVILGHSEPRSIFGETNELINKKIKKALTAGLLPIFCVGESLEEREKNITNDVIKQQILEGLKDVSEEELSKIIIAYEPVWAIGTGKVASPQQAEDVHAFIRNLIQEKYSLSASDNLIIQYGGSVKPDNAKELLGQKDIDGALVGGACLKADSFVGIMKGC